MLGTFGALALVTLVAIPGAAGNDGGTANDRLDVKAAAPPTSPAALVAGLRVAVDPATGTLVAPSPEQAERTALELDRVLGRARAGRVRTVRRADGTVAAAVPLRLMSFSVVRLRPDGALEESCVEGLPAPSDPEDRP